ncbi:hypothetical protein [Streptomyces canus]|uniref:hypothetical protein n=1 Tax=Streptomyces canus TaxID=58343 RepID=UPI00381E1783
MLAYFIPLVSAVVAGTATFWLRTWVDRVRLDLSLVSIVKRRDPEDRVTVGERLAEVSRNFTAGPPIDESAKESEIEKTYDSAKDVQQCAASQIGFARALKSRLQDCRTKQDKIEFLQDLMDKHNLVFREITIGLQRHELTISPNKRSPSGGAQDLFESKPATMNNREVMVLEFPTFYQVFSGDAAPGGPGTHDRLVPLIEAMKKFDVNALRQCLDFAIKAIREDHSYADILMGGLEKTINSGPFKVHLLVVNRGKSAAVLNPYAALQTSGATSALDPLLLRIIEVIDAHENKTEVPLGSFVSIEPRSVVTLILQSDPVELSSPLTAAYDKELLGCSIMIVRVKKSSRNGTMNKPQESARKDFGAKLDQELHKQVIGLAARRR